MIWKPLPDQNDARRAIDQVNREFSSRRSATLARMVEDIAYPTDGLLEEAIAVHGWAFQERGISERTRDVRIENAKRRKA